MVKSQGIAQNFSHSHLFARLSGTDQCQLHINYLGEGLLYKEKTFIHSFCTINHHCLMCTSFWVRIMHNANMSDPSFFGFETLKVSVSVWVNIEVEAMIVTNLVTSKLQE